MNKDDILVLRPLYNMKDYDVDLVRLDIKHQLRRGNVITIPFGWDVVTKPADTKVEVEEKPEETSTPWDFIDNNNYSPFDSQGKERMIFCTECGISIEHYDPMYQYCPYCGKRHYFNKQEDKETEGVTRSYIMSHNEIRMTMGLDPIIDPAANKLIKEDRKEDKDEEIWCTECPHFKDIVDDDQDWFGALCTKDGHESSPSMYAIQSLHNDCPLKRKEGE